MRNIQTADSEADSEIVVFFDGSCPLCRTETNIYRRHDSEGALRFVDVSDPMAVLPERLGRDEAMARFHVLSRGGELLSGAAAFAALWRQLPGWRWAGRLATLPGADLILTLGYRLFLSLRPAFVRLFLFVRRVRDGSRISVP